MTMVIMPPLVTQHSSGQKHAANNPRSTSLMPSQYFWFSHKVVSPTFAYYLFRMYKFSKIYILPSLYLLHEIHGITNFVFKFQTIYLDFIFSLSIVV